MLVVLILIVLGVIFFGGGYVRETFAPEVEERPYIGEVQIEEFVEINKQLNLTEYIENVEVDSEGNIIYIEDKDFGISYKVVDGKGDISAQEYKEERSKYILEKEAREDFRVKIQVVVIVLMIISVFWIVRMYEQGII